MDPAANKKRRYQKNNHNENYHPRYRKHSRDWNWRSDSDNFRDGNRYHNTNRPPGGGSHEGGRQQFTDSNPFSCDIQIHLIGRKMKDPMIHVCETCSLPIRSYGRMIPCKHVFCFSCAKKTDNNCPRCKDSVQRIEQCPLGSVWLCSVTNSCKRTYLSQRDLQAHMDHRHKPVNPVVPHPLVLPPASVVGSHPPITVPPPPLIPRADPFMMVSAPPSSAAPVVSMPVCLPSTVTESTANPRPSSNLITIQIQDSQANPQPANSFPPPPPPRRPLNQPQLIPPQNPHVPSSQQQRF